MKTNNANYDIKVNGNSISFIDRATNGTVLKMEATLSSLSEARISEILLMVALTLNK